MFEHVPNKKEIARRIEDCRLAGGEVLDLSYLYITELPEELRALRLESLKLDHNELTVIPEWLGSMTSLRKLDLSGNEKLKSLPRSFKRLCNLETLDISATSLGKVPKCVREYKKLKKLSLGGVWYKSLFKSIVIPRWIGELTNLEYLNIGCWVTKIPESIDKLQNLRRMDISTSKLKTLPKSIGNLSALKELSVNSSNGIIKRLPESFCNLVSLEKLELSGNCKLKKLPGSFGNLKSLRELHLCGRIEYLPESFGRLSSLYELIIQAMKFAICRNHSGICPRWKD